MNIRYYQVLVFPFRKLENGNYEYAIFKRIRSGMWQVISGGGKKDESFIAAAKRECFEEAGLPESAQYYSLETINSVPIHYFSEPTPKGKYVINENCFAVDCSGLEIKLSDEHSEFLWVDYNTANDLLYWDSNKTGLWELNQRLKNKNMIKINI